MLSCLNPGTIGGGLAYDEFLALARRHGFEAVEAEIEWLVEKAATEGEEAAKEWLAQQGIRHSAFWLPVAWQRDEATFKDGMRELPSKAKVAQAVGCPSCITYIPPAIAGDPAEFWAMMIWRFREVSAVLADFSIRFGIEWVAPLHHRSRGNPVLWRMDQALSVCDEVGAPNIGLLVDSFHWFCAGHTDEEIRAVPKERIVHVHINDAPDRPRDEQIDNDRLMPADGIIDLVSFLRGLKEAGYDDAISVEVLSTTLPNQFSRDELAAKAKAGLDKVMAQI